MTELKFDWLTNPSLEGKISNHPPERISYKDWYQRECAILNMKPFDGDHILVSIDDYTEDFTATGLTLDFNQQGQNVFLILMGGEVFPINYGYMFRLRMLGHEYLIYISEYDKRLENVIKLREYAHKVRFLQAPSKNTKDSCLQAGFAYIPEKEN